MSSGSSYYAVESAEAREKRLLAESRTRRERLIATLLQVSAKQRSLGLPVSEFQATDGDSIHTQAQCSHLETLIDDAESGIRAELGRRERTFAQEQLAAAMTGITVDPGLAQELARTRTAARSSRHASAKDAVTAQLAALATAVVERQDVADPEIATRVAQALAETPERATMLLTALRDDVDRRNARHREAVKQAALERRRIIDAAAEAAARAEETRFVEGAVREALRTLGYQVTDTEAVGAENALVVRSAAHPEHAVLAVTGQGRIQLDTVRISGAASPGLDRMADQALCSALAAFRDELEKRGIKTTRVSHLPAGFFPMVTRELRKRRDPAAQAETRERQR